METKLSEYLPIFFLVAIALGMHRLAQIHERLLNTGAKLDAHLRHLGVEWGAKFAEPSDLVKDLAQRPESKVAALKSYREQTGLDLKAVNEVIKQLARAAETSKSLFIQTELVQSLGSPSTPPPSAKTCGGYS